MVKKLFFALSIIFLYFGEVYGQATAARMYDADGNPIGSTGGALNVSGSFSGGGDGAVVDGVSAAIKATVFDRTNSNPLAAQLVDSNGDPVSVGGGTQYNQGTAATDTDSLTMAGCVRADAAAVATGVVNGDRARCIVDSIGRLWVNVGTVAVTGPLTDAELRAVPVPISGTVTVTDGSGALNVIVDSLPTVTVTDGAGALNVIVDSSALPSGAATSANQSTIIGHVDGLEASLSTIAGAVAGSEMQVDVLTLPSVTIGTFPDNEPFNVAQINGVTPLMGAGNTGTGSPRVTIATDQAAITVRAGNSNAIIACTANAKLNMTTATTTEIVALSGSTRIYVCSYSIMTSAAANVKFVDGTGTNCGTSQSDVSSNMHFIATMPGMTRGGGLGMLLKTSTDGDALCVTSSAAVNVDIDISYAQF